jgi:outer membrane lipoprotein SlyB
MNTTTTLTPDSTPSPGATRAPWMRHAWLIAGGVGLATVGLAAGLAMRPAPPAELVTPGSLEATKASLASNEAVVPAKPTDLPAAQPETATPVPAKPATKKPAPRTAAAVSGREATQQHASVCATCGVVEGVREVQVKGEGTGLGAIAGGVLGGAIGNQAGKGNGRKAMTVIGAVGGGLAGHEIEKRARGEVMYDVTVRMDDGSVRTLRQKTAPAKGARVTVDGTTLRSAA